MTSSRKFGQDKLAAAAHTLDWTIQHIKDFLELGYMEKEEFAKPCILITNTVVDLQEAINKLRETL